MKIYFYGKDCSWRYSISNIYGFYYKFGDELVNGIVSFNEGEELFGIYQNGKLHNLNGPALITKTGKLEYWINHEHLGNNLSKKEFQKKVKELVFK